MKLAAAQYSPGVAAATQFGAGLPGAGSSGAGSASAVLPQLVNRDERQVQVWEAALPMALPASPI